MCQIEVSYQPFHYLERAGQEETRGTDKRVGHYDPGITTQGALEAEGRKKPKTELGIPSSLVL